MYHCKDCEFEFLYPEIITEKHGLKEPPFERLSACPNCTSTNIEEQKTPHCKYCGRRLKESDNEYCTKECRRLGELMWREQQRQRNKYENSSLVSIVREIEAYNRTNNTRYTYGNYVGKILIGGK